MTKFKIGIDMKKLSLFIFAAMLLFFPHDGVTATQDNYQPIHPGGLKSSWAPDSTISNYRILLQNPNIVRFKVFIPVSNNAKVMCAVGQSTGALYKFSARIGIPPSESIPSGTLSSSGFASSQLVNDCFGQNSSGYLRIWSTGGGSGQWLYVYLKTVSGSILNIQVTVSVDYPSYKAWFDSTAWDASGNPISGLTTTPVPSPSPTASPVQDACDIVEIKLSQDQFDAISSGRLVRFLK